MKQDRFLLGILIFIVVLVVAAVGLFFLRQGDQSYGPDDTPQGVVRNYALAVQKMDIQKAYSYLADQPGRPTFENFRNAFLTNQLNTTNTSLQVGAVNNVSDSEAMVEVVIVFSSGDPFSNPWSNNQNASLVKQNGEWKLTFMPNPYWGWDWFQPTPVKAP